MSPLNTLPFSISSAEAFEKAALDTFRYQAQYCAVYKEFIAYLGVDSTQVNSIKDIPFLPIQFFKSHKIINENALIEQTFLSSGTTGMSQSKHYVANISVYEESYQKGFNLFYGPVEDYVVLALLPSYLEREGSSLIYMVEDMIRRSKHIESGFYLNDIEVLKNQLLYLESQGKKTLLIGVSFALLDLVESYQFSFKNTIVMETGGMKGKRKEMVREELHNILKSGFGVDVIHSEYGMTELLSQAYSKGNGLFSCPPWMCIMIRDTEDPLSLLPLGKTGGINVIDLANVNSCSFLATQDLGRLHTNGDFEILGRFDNSDIRGCNLLVS
ncbi:MAG: acyl transferase [Flavicella sp.]